jgi:hypothetical protein
VCLNSEEAALRQVLLAERGQGNGLVADLMRYATAVGLVTPDE